MLYQNYFRKKNLFLKYLNKRRKRKDIVETKRVLNKTTTEVNSILQKQPPKGVLKKVVLKMCSKFTGEHPCRSVITLRQRCSPVNLLHIFRTPFTKNTSGWLPLYLKGELHSNSRNLTFVNKLQFPLILQYFVFKASKNW